jgi:p-methyltransferase
MGARWSHDTMDSDEATQIRLDFFSELTDATHIDPDTSLWYLAYLYDQGYDFTAIRSLQDEINGIMRRQLRSIERTASLAEA